MCRVRALKEISSNSYPRLLRKEAGTPAAGNPDSLAGTGLSFYPVPRPVLDKAASLTIL